MSLTKVPNTMLETPGGGGGGGTAASISYVPTAPLTGTNVQTALDQLAVSSGATGVTTLRADLLDSTGAASKGGKLIGFKEAGTGTVGRLVDSKLNDLVSLKDFGAVGDGIVDDTTAIVAASNDAREIYVPEGSYKSSNAATSLSGRFQGPGQIVTSGTKRGKVFNSISTAPTSHGSEGSVLTAFSGDLSRQPDSVEHRITGSTTAGSPSTGYLYSQEVFPHYTYLENSSGWNQSTSSNSGRTGIAAYRTLINHSGQGDVVCYNALAQVSSTKPGATHFLANPAAVLFNGDTAASVNGAYLNPYETNCSDNGFDIAAVGIVNNFFRTNNTGALSAFWGGYRAQSFGSAPMDNLISAPGKWQVGIDFALSSTDFGTNRAAISLKANQRIYLNNTAGALGSLQADWRSTVFNGDWIGYDTSINGTIIAAGGNPTFQVKTAGALILGGFQVLKGATVIIDFANAVSNKIFMGNAGYTISLNQTIEYTSQTISGSASSGGGGASALPALPFGYKNILIDGTVYKIAIYQN
jgi:hypothetical protein